MHTIDFLANSGYRVKAVIPFADVVIGHLGTIVSAIDSGTHNAMIKVKWDNGSTDHFSRNSEYMIDVMPRDYRRKMDLERF